MQTNKCRDYDLRPGCCSCLSMSLHGVLVQAPLRVTTSSMVSRSTRSSVKSKRKFDDCLLWMSATPMEMKQRKKKQTCLGRDTSVCLPANAVVNQPKRKERSDTGSIFQLESHYLPARESLPRRSMKQRRERKAGREGSNRTEPELHE